MSLKDKGLNEQEKTADSIKLTKKQQEFLEYIILSMKRHKKLLDSLKKSL